MIKISKKYLKKNLKTIFKKEGYSIIDSKLKLKGEGQESKREVHALAKRERIKEHKQFIINKARLIRRHVLDGSKLDVDKIKPRLIEVKGNTKWEDIFRWWNIMWWSLPYERGYGRQMRFIVWDQYHKAPIGLIGLQSPILSWKVRDDYIGITANDRDYWVNQSLSAQRLGALPPYNYILGGKLVAYLMTSDIIRNKFKNKYKNQKSIMKKRTLPARLLFITTTGAYGKSSVYTRLKYKGDYVAKFIGYSSGAGSFHIPNTTYLNLIAYLKKKKINIKRGFGTGPSRKMRLISKALDLLGFKNGQIHGIQRAVYIFPLVTNMNRVIKNSKRPKWIHRDIPELTSYWKERWAKPRLIKNNDYLEFKGKQFIDELIKDIENSPSQ